MYIKTKVKIPDIPGKIIIRKGLYVMLEVGRKYNNEKKYNVPDRVTIGKLADEDGYMYPNEKYVSYFPEEKLPEYDDEIGRSSCLRIGTYLVIRKIFEDSNLLTIIEKQFGADSGLLMDLVTYSIIEENNASQYYPDYAYNHPLFTEGYKIYSDSRISSFLNEVTDDQRIEFLNDWNHNRDDKQKIYISYDSTNKNCQAGDVVIAEMGHAKDDDGKPIVNYSIGYDHNNREPLFYEEYPGSIVDVSQLDYMIGKAEGYGYKKIGFILDRGYFSKGNLKHMDEKKYPFIIMAKGTAKFINGFVNKVCGSFETDRKYRIGKYHCYGKTIKEKMFNTDDRDRYIHIYYNGMRAEREREEFEAKIEQLYRNVRKLIGTDKATKPYEKYFRVERDKDGIIAAIGQRNAQIDKLKKQMGYFVIVTSTKMTADEALHLYKSRDESEKLFRTDKTFLGNGVYRVQTDESLKAKMLVEFIALIVRNKIFTQLDDLMDAEGKQNYLTVPAAIRELEKIEMVRQSDGIYRMDHAVSKRQRVILKAFGIEARRVPYMAKELSEKLAKADGIRI